MRNRGTAIIIENNKLVLIKRIRDGKVYYVFPGGGMKHGETPEEATQREAFEELGVIVHIRECFEKIEFDGTQYYFFADIVKGEIGTGMGEEFTDTNRNRGTYEPVWVEIGAMHSIEVRPREVADKIQKLGLSGN